jgi:CHAD domain-containing protein
MAEIIQPVTDAFPHDERLEALAARAAKEQFTAREAARAAVASPVYGRLVLALVVALHGPDFAEVEGSHDLSTFAKAILKKARRRVKRRAARAGDLDPLALHALRIAAKHLRYSLDFLAMLYRRDRVREETARLTALQSDLGYINDLANARRLLLAQAIVPPPQVCEALALVEGWHRGHMEPLLAALPQRLAALAGKRGRS